MRRFLFYGALLLLVAQLATARPKYVFFNYRQGGQWNLANPATLTRAVPDEIRNTLQVKDTPELALGVSYIFSYMGAPLDVWQQSLRNLLLACQAAKMPVLITLDGENWWQHRPDLWNWWDPDKPGYNPDNVNNVEWTGWSPKDAVKICWRNWGRQIRVAPAPNLMSRRVLEAHFEGLKALVPVVVDWYNSLPDDEKYLCGGIKVGWEASIGVNAFYYPGGNSYLTRWPKDASHDPTYGLDNTKGLSGGVAQLGYASVSTAGIKHSGELTRDDLAQVVHTYLALLARKVNYLGMPRDLVFTHQGGTYKPWDEHMPFWPAFNQWSLPGWSFYFLYPQDADGLGETLEHRGDTRWAAAEWWWPGGTPQGWCEHFARTLKFEDCQFICVYNWGLGSFKPKPGAIDGVRELFAKWPTL